MLTVSSAGSPVSQWRKRRQAPLLTASGRLSPAAGEGRQHRPRGLAHSADTPLVLASEVGESSAYELHSTSGQFRSRPHRRRSLGTSTDRLRLASSTISMNTSAAAVYQGKIADFSTKSYH